MDTRTKILTPAKLASFRPPGPVLLVTGRFDLLRVEVARELAEARRRTAAGSLVVAVSPARDQLLGVEARAEMAAALRVVDYVFIAGKESLDGWVAKLQPVETISLEHADADRVGRLIERLRGPKSA